MKFRILLTVLLVVLSSALIGQTDKNTPQRMQLVKIDGKSIEEQQALLTRNIQQIDSKILFIKNNPVLLREAENAGYLKELYKLKKVSEDKLKLLQKQNK